MINFDFALDTGMKLHFAERDELIDIVRRRQSEEWRKDVADYYKKLKKDLIDGKLKPISAKEAIKELNLYLETND